MHEAEHAITFIFIVFVAAQLGGELARRIALPSVVGEIAAGCLIGEKGLHLIHDSPVLEVFSEIGAVLLLFSVGLETRLRDLIRVGKLSFGAGALGVIVPLVTVYTLTSYVFEYTLAASLFFASAFVATSAGVTARVLQELNVLQRIESRVILGAAVIDDILAMLVLGVVSGIQNGTGANFISFVVILLQAVGFILFITLLGTKFMKRFSYVLDVPLDPQSAFMLSVVICLGLSLLSTKIGLAAIIGAFLGGIVLAESKQRHELEKQFQTILSFFVPFFFVITGSKVDFTALSSMSHVYMLLLWLGIAIITKVIGCTAASLSLGFRSALVIGVGMIPRGEVGIIIASLGRALGVFDAVLYAEIIIMSLVTSMVTPPVLKQLLKGLKDEPYKISSPKEEDSYLFQVDESGRS
jgi:Kef-type K+ transport system membrane component KefB